MRCCSARFEYVSLGLNDHTGAVPAQVRGFGYTVPTYLVGSVGSIIRRPIVARTFYFGTFMLTKKSIRDSIIKQRDSCAVQWRIEASDAIAHHAQELKELTEGVPIAGYWPIGSEADPRLLMRILAQNGCGLCLPLIAEPHMIYRSYAFDDMLAPASWGTFEPLPTAAKVTPRTLIVPLAAFDAKGGRIGWGKGYYDRSIAALKPVITIGIAYSFQQVDHVPIEPHDAPLDYIITEKGMIRS